MTGARKGVLFDAWLDDGTPHAPRRAEREERIATKRGSVRALKTAAFAGIRGGAGDDLRVRAWRWTRVTRRSCTAIA